MDPEYGFNQTAVHLKPDFQRFDAHMAVLTIFLVLFGFVFNILIFYVFWGMRKSASALIFLNLAAVDVVLVCLVMPYSVTILLTRALGDKGPPHHLFCAVSGCLFETSVLCTVGFILLASADRFLGVYHHVYHRKYFSRYNLMKMILCIWVISPMLILTYVTSWLIFSTHEDHKTFTNLKIFTVCMGQYWLRNENHVLGNVPSYLTVALLTLLMVVIVIGNLAVLKQLFKKKEKALASLQTAGPATRQRRKNVSVLVPPVLIQTGSTQTIQVAKEQLKRISLAEQDVRKSERIFQTDSNGDVTGININAIMKLYVKATRRAKCTTHTNSQRRISSRGSPSNRKSSENFLKSDSAETPPIVDNLLLTPKNSTVGGSLIGSVIAEEEEEEEEDEEEDEELEFELSEEDIDEELAILAVDSPICCDGEDSTGSISLSPDDEDEEEEEATESDVDTIWKVIKFVAALKRNSKKRAGNWDSDQLHSKSLCTEKEGETEKWDSFIPRRDLVRSSSDSDLSLLQDNCSNIDYRIVTPAKEKKARKYSEMSNAYLTAHSRSLPYQPLSFERSVKSPTMEELNELVNGGELSPLVKRNKQPDLASLITMVTRLKRRSKEAKQRVSHTTSFARRTSTIVDAILPKRSCGGEANECSQELFKEDKTKPSSSSWGTLAVIAKMRSKFIKNRERRTPSSEPDSDLQTETDFLSSTSDQVEMMENRGINIPLNTITEAEEVCSPERQSGRWPEEVCSPERQSGRWGEEAIVPERRNNLLALPPAFSPAATPIKKNSLAGEKSSPNFNRSRSLDLDAFDPNQMGSQPIKRRRGGFLINKDDMMTPSPSPSMFGNGSNTPQGSVPRDSCYGNAPSSFGRRVRQSMSMRNSLNITSVTTMVYNFNKHAAKKKKEIRAAKTILILVFYYIFTLLLFVVSFYHVSMLEESQKAHLSYWLTFYSYIIYINAVLNPVIHFWRNAKVRRTVIKIICPKKVNEKIRRWKLRGGFG